MASTPPDPNAFWSLDAAGNAARLSSGPQGLSSDEAAARLERPAAAGLPLLKSRATPVETRAMKDQNPPLAIPEELPVLPLRDLVVFPYMTLPLFVVRERSIAAVEDALAGDRLVLLATQRDPEIEDPEPDDLYAVGTVAMVMRILRMSDGRLKALVQGLAKARVESFVEEGRTAWARVLPIPADDETEFFADATEAFYCQPAALRDEFQNVYELLKAYYHVDPLRWFPDAE